MQITNRQSDGPRAGSPQDYADVKVLHEDVFRCVSKSNEYYRLVLTTTQVILHLQGTKDPSHIERYSVEDLFGCHTLRHKKKSSDNIAAYICFYLYPRSKKKGMLSNIKYRDKLTLVFEVKKPGTTYEENLEVATKWKQVALGVLGAKYPKWQLQKPLMNQNNNRDSNEAISNLAIESLDEMDHLINTGESKLSLSSFILCTRRFLVVLNPKSGQGKTISIFQEKVAPVLTESGVKMELLITQHSGHARNMMASADLSEIDGIVTVGGDGILYEVLNGLRCRKDAIRVANIPIGIIAGGSGNGLARSIAQYSGESDDYLKNPVLSTTLAAARGKVMKVNLLEVDLNDKKVYSFLSIGWGLLADIDVESEVLRALGESRFTIWSFYRLAKLRSYKAQLSYIPWDKASEDKINNGNVPNETIKMPEPVVVNSNFIVVYAVCQSHIGTELRFAPDASPDDGLIHLVYMEGNVGRTRATQFLLNMDNGGHLSVDGVKYVTVKEFTIKADGELGGNLTIDGERVISDKITVKLASKPLNVFAL